MNKIGYQKFLEAVDTVCMNCLKLSEENCEKCPVRFTCDEINKEMEGSNMNRIDNIAKFAQKREQEQTEKEMAKTRRIEGYKAQIRALKPRIDELLLVGNACLEHGIALEGEAWGGHQGYDTHQFITNGWSHLLGFVCGRDQRTREVLPFTQLGIMGGGACHFDLRTDGVTVDVSGSDALYVLKRFVDEFDKFETEFYKYVDKVTA